MAAVGGKPEIGLGDALGGNVVNIGLILGLALLFGALPVRFCELRRDFVLALIVPILTLILAADTLSHTEGILLLGLFMVWLVLMVNQAVRHREKTVQADTSFSTKPTYASLLLLVGLTCLLFFCNRSERYSPHLGGRRLYYWSNLGSPWNLFVRTGDNALFPLAWA